MPRSLALRIPVVELQLTSGHTLREAVGFGWRSTESSAESLVDDGLKRLDRESLRYGDYLPVMHGRPPESIETDRLEVVFELEDVRSGAPSLTLAFDILLASYAHGPLRGFVPALGTVASADTAEDVRAALVDMIRLDFDRYRRLEELRQVLVTQWYTSLEVVYEERTIQLYSPGELSQFAKEREFPESVLETVATPMSWPRFKAFGMDDVHARIKDATSGAIRGSVLVVGPPGSGKTAIIRHWAARCGEKVWQTSASQLVTELTRDMGWQAAFTDLCKEIAERKEYLYVGDLAELMEVGRYVGNPVSIGEALRPWIERGAMRVVAELTEEAAATLDATIPGYRQLFVEVRIPERSSEEMAALSRDAVDAIAAKHRISVEERGFDEGFVLLSRFAPYSGFPGRPIRFFESLIRSAPQGATLDRDDVLLAFSEESGLPLDLIDAEATLDVPGLTEWFRARLFGQDAAIDGVVDVIAMMKSRLNRPGRPAATMLFAGPTGVGKTQLTRLVAEHLFGDSERMVRFDMSEYAHPAAAMRLIAGPNGEGLLTGAVRREPFSVLLFDEIEKAHLLVFDMLLQILGEGRLTGEDGRVTDFCSTIIILTSNLGVSEDRSMIRGFGHEDAEAERARRLAAYQRAVREFFRPEFVGRLDRLIVFSPLLDGVLHRVARAALRSLVQRPGLAHRGIELEVSERAVERLVEVGADPRYGARPLERAADRHVAVPLARAMAASSGAVGHVQVDANEAGITVATVPVDEERETHAAQLYRLSDEIAQLRQSVGSVLLGRACAMLQESVDVWHRKLLTPRNARDGAFARTMGGARVAEGVLRAFHELLEGLEGLEMSVLEAVRTADYEAHELYRDEYDAARRRVWDRYMDLLGRVVPDGRAVLVVVSSRDVRASSFAVDHYLRVCEAFGWESKWMPLNEDRKKTEWMQVDLESIDHLFEVQYGRDRAVMGRLDGAAVWKLMEFEVGTIESRQSEQTWAYNTTFCEPEREQWPNHTFGSDEDKGIIRTLTDEHIKYTNGGKVERPKGVDARAHFAELSINAIRQRIIAILMRGAI